MTHPAAVASTMTREVYLERLAKSLKRWRFSSELSKAQVAAAIGVSATSISNWEDGLSVPNAFDLERLIKFYKLLNAERRAAAKAALAETEVAAP